MDGPSTVEIPQDFEGDLRSVIIPVGMVRDRIKKMAQDIHKVVGNQQLSLLCVLKGSYKFFTALVDELSSARRECPFPLTVDFIRCVSYEGTSSTGKVNVIGLSNLADLNGKNVLVVDDIVDTGRTLSLLLKELRDIGVKQHWTTLLVSKRVRRTMDVPEDFVAFYIPDKFIVGYGLDYYQKFRDLNHICILSDEGIAKYK